MSDGVTFPPPALRKNSHERHVVATGTSDHTRIQDAIDALPSGRSHVATVVIHGDAEIGSTISVPDYTRIVVGGRLKPASSFEAAFFRNSNHGSDHTTGNVHLYFEGGIYHGQSGGTAGATDMGLIDLENVIDFGVQSIKFIKSKYHGFKGVELYRGNVDQCRAIGCEKRGLSMVNVESAPQFSNNISGDDGHNPVICDGCFVHANGEQGLYLDAMHDFQLSQINGEDNGLAGVYWGRPINATWSGGNLERNGQSISGGDPAEVFIDLADAGGAGFTAGALSISDIEVGNLFENGVWVEDAVTDGTTRYALNIDFRAGIGASGSYGLRFSINSGRVSGRLSGVADGGSGNGIGLFIGNFDDSSTTWDLQGVSIEGLVCRNMFQGIQLRSVNNIHISGGSLTGASDTAIRTRSYSGLDGPQNISVAGTRLTDNANNIRKDGNSESTASDVTFLACPGETQAL